MKGKEEREIGIGIGINEPPPPECGKMLNVESLIQEVTETKSLMVSGMRHLSNASFPLLVSTSPTRISSRCPPPLLITAIDRNKKKDTHKLK